MFKILSAYIQYQHRVVECLCQDTTFTDVALVHTVTLNEKTDLPDVGWTNDQLCNAVALKLNVSVDKVTITEEFCTDDTAGNTIYGSYNIT